MIANMIGAGVFTTSGFSLQTLGTPRLVVLAWLAGGVIALTGAISYGRLIAAMPESGGEYLFLSRAVHPFAGFLAGWVSLIAGFSGAIAFAASALEGYLVPDAFRPSWLPNGAVAITAILTGGLLHGIRPRFGAVAQNVIVALKLLVLLQILIYGARRLPTDDWSMGTSGGPELNRWSQVQAFAGSLVWISLSYSGFNAAVYVASEVKNPSQTVPRALITGTLCVSLLYVLLNTVFIYSADPAELMGREDIAAVAARAIGGSRFALFVRSVIVLCLLTSVLSMMMAAPRVYARMADDGILPSFLKFQGQSPGAAIVMQMAVAMLLVTMSSLQGLLSYLGLTLSLSAACSVGCLVLPKIRRRPLLHPEHIFPALYITATLVCAIILSVSQPLQFLGTFLTFVFGACAYAVTVRGRNSVDAGTRSSGPNENTMTE